MKTQHTGLIPVSVLPIGRVQSLPAQVSSPYPAQPVVPAVAREHPQPLSTTVDVPLHPTGPVYLPSQPL
jgi:hypothetical protein